MGDSGGDWGDDRSRRGGSCGWYCRLGGRWDRGGVFRGKPRSEGEDEGKRIGSWKQGRIWTSMRVMWDDRVLHVPRVIVVKIVSNL